MSAVWRASRGAVRRRRLQTILIGVVVALSTTTIVIALGLLAGSSAPFDQAYARRSGAHLVAAFDSGKVTAAQLTATGSRAGVEAAAGPFAQASVDVTVTPANAGAGSGPQRQMVAPPQSQVVVGRAGPGGPVDKLNLWRGRWATGPGEIVLNQSPAGPSQGTIYLGSDAIGSNYAITGGPGLKVVGIAYTVSQSADGWVAPAQIAQLHPTTFQMLYRFTHAATAAQLNADRGIVTAGPAAAALQGSQSYLTLRATFAAQPKTLVPFLIVFGILALAVAVLIIVNVVSGAVVAGFRHIGVLKALGFTPTQVMAVYLAMVSIPAVAGCAVGTVLGNLLARPLLTRAFLDLGSGSIGVPIWVDVAALIGTPLVVAASALLPARRARSLSATEAISAGSTQHTGRGLAVQRWLSGTRLPRAVSLGLGLPFARPARSALTAAAVVLGVTSVTLAIGLASSIGSYGKAADRSGAVQAQFVSPPGPDGGNGTDPSALSDTADEQLMRSTPGARYVSISADVPVRQVGSTQETAVRFYRGDSAHLGYTVLQGHWPTAAGQVLVSARMLLQRSLSVGDTLTLQAQSRRTSVQIVGAAIYNDGDVMLADWSTLPRLAPGTRGQLYEIQLKPGTSSTSYENAVSQGDPRLIPQSLDDVDSFIVTMFIVVTLLTLMLGTVSALGVLNTVVLNTRERRRDLGMLKSIGMTPGQVVLMLMTSMAALGAAGGLIGIPIGITIHHLVIPAMARAAQVTIPDFMLHVYHVDILALLALAGIAIAALGAYLPARSAAKVTIAQVLHNE